MISDFLFELGCEELPAGELMNLAEALRATAAAKLAKADLHYNRLEIFATPRRLALLIYALQHEQPPQKISRRGPALAAAYDQQGQPTAALLGFAKSCSVQLDQLTIIKTDKGEWLTYETEVSGVLAKDIMPELIKEIIKALPVNKAMRWGSGEDEFARPVHWAVMLLGEEVLAAKILGVQTGCITYGHRFHAPAAIKIKAPHDYEHLLQQAYVIADFTKRRQVIVEQIKSIAAGYDAEAVMPDTLVDEVTCIVEWPAALSASFAADFLDVPAEALIASMQGHQKCFALTDKANKLLRYFITVSNIASSNPAQVIAGNEKVMRARLSDAAFFYQQDRKQPLAGYIPATAKVVFQAKLGSLFDKTNRVQKLLMHLVKPLKLNEQHMLRAVILSKCDLMTGMVGEFPELQGLIGYYYALHDNEPKEVAAALYEQYLPRFSGDDLPQSLLGKALSLADRIDTLMGIFTIGQKPSGDKDPFKLRRHALAVVRLLMEISSEINLSELLKASAHTFDQLVVEATIISDVHAFILERIPAYYQSQGISSELINAVLARQENWLYDVNKRLMALHGFIMRPEAAVLSAACKRVANILGQHKRDDLLPIEETLLQEKAEKNLWQKLNEVEQFIQPLYQEKDYAAVLSQLTKLREPVDAFFAEVMVMVEDSRLRANRIALLSRLADTLNGVADISLLPGSL